ncbi:acetyl-CoA C-acyltransferase [Rhodococcus opacus]|uniref:acetyl-CoA C-acyltransferase n=1 Tax=Rhodococcus opacus TaxID=37919 RepID=UPI00146EBB6E|nr:acetyl-CoA C-acyltransferase [Rhodococcus opacus]MDJ0415369.1 acetyl-CoA C-acyltransferase [Rhodococcus opacus]MDV7090942.1 acetyl-CoA C-acyltransferase [Rhodococcus opacus]UNN04696.1 acetyl-CoA C-acyltransferase [Rhodococcus opacus]WKN52493.1 acetyl-CoA C-acyltransferase [Rhodococcus opacus]
MRSAVIVDVVRTPSGKGKPGGQLSHLHPVNIYADVLNSLTERTGLDPRLVDDVITGCVSQVSEQSSNIARSAVLAAGWPEHVPGTTIDRQCGSSQQALHFAAQGVMAGAYDIVIAGGVELMSRVPMFSPVQGDDPYGDRLTARYNNELVNQGVSAELVADKWELSRRQLDEYAAESHRRAVTAASDGGFASEIIPVGTATHDETVRANTTSEGLAGLKLSFETPESRTRFPDIEWRITPGNSSPLTDGASAALIMGEDTAKSLGLRPRARFHSFAVVGDDPIFMLTAPIPATQKVLSKAGLTIDDIDAFEVNEAFASVPLAWLKETGADPAKLNPRGGAIALGHPPGASGTRLMSTMLNYLESTGGRFGLQTMCEAAGMANATVIERI